MPTNTTTSTNVSAAKVTEPQVEGVKVSSLPVKSVAAAPVVDTKTEAEKRRRRHLGYI